MYLADMTILDGRNTGRGPVRDIEVNFFKNDEDKFECFQFLSRGDDGGNSVVVPISQIDDLMAMLQKIKEQQAKEA